MNSSQLKRGHPKRKVIFQAPFFRGLDECNQLQSFVNPDASNICHSLHPFFRPRRRFNINSWCLEPSSGRKMFTKSGWPSTSKAPKKKSFGMECSYRQHLKCFTCICHHQHDTTSLGWGIPYKLPLLLVEKGNISRWILPCYMLSSNFWG